MSRSKDMNNHNQTCKCDACQMQTARSFFSGSSPISFGSLSESLMFDNIFSWQIFPSTARVSEKIREKTADHLGDIEFALNEQGDPDGIKNRQEIILTVANEVAEEMMDETCKNLEKFLANNDHVDEVAMELLKESKED